MNKSKQLHYIYYILPKPGTSWSFKWYLDLDYAYLLVKFIFRIKRAPIVSVQSSIDAS